MSAGAAEDEAQAPSVGERDARPERDGACGKRARDVAADQRLGSEVTTYPLDAANTALEDLRAGRVQGAAVLVP